MGEKEKTVSERSKRRAGEVQGNRYLQVAILFCLFFLPLYVHGATPEKMDVFVSIPPLEWLCEQLAGPQVAIHLLIAKGQEPHTFEPSPHQIRALSGARLFFTAGLPFEADLSARFRAGNISLQSVDTSEGIRKIPISAGEHGHGHGELDPHVWLSPGNVKQMARQMVAGLVAADPEHEVLYRANLSDLNTKLDVLDRDITELLAPYVGSSFFVFHPAFGYFANRYQLHQVAVETGGKSPTPKQLFALIKKAKAEGVKVLFVQPQFDPRSAENVARAIGGTVLPLDPLAGNSVESMRIMAQKIAAALSGVKQ
jgi:zinc transport system substrate-binding protein